MPAWGGPLSWSYRLEELEAGEGKYHELFHAGRRVAATCTLLQLAEGSSERGLRASVGGGTKSGRLTSAGGRGG